jgi:hypothetical protein
LQVLTEQHSPVCVSGIPPAEQGKVLCLVERGGLAVQVRRQKRLVQRAMGLCTWESDLANVTEINDRTGHEVGGGVHSIQDSDSGVCVRLTTCGYCLTQKTSPESFLGSGRLC